MSFNTALSGLNAASSDLGVISNNIANVNTTGFKFSRAEFGDIYATSVFGNSKTAIGAGVILQDVAQQFSQGNLSFTSNSLDMAVNGEGFFVLSPSIGSTEKIYSRAGAFGIDANGFVVNGSGQYLQAFPVNAADGTVTSTSLSSLQNLQLSQTAGTPSETDNIDIGMNLPATEATPANAVFDPTDDTSYNHATSISFFDSLGNTHVATYYFVKDAVAANTWHVFTTVDSTNGVPNPVTFTAPLAASATLVFDNTGHLDTTLSDNGGVITTQTLGTGGAGITSFDSANPNQTLTIDFANNGPTQFNSAFSVTTLTQDGFGVGRLSGIEISESGVVRANFSNGQSTALGKVALARFPNSQGLRQLGNTNWAETNSSGAALAGEATTASFGSIRSGALEASNVDLTKELVNLITAQRNFQANARSIETANTTTQAILQIR